MWYLINSWKVLSENPQPPSLKKSKNPLPPKNSKSVGHPYFSTSKIFQPLPAERGGRTLWNSLFLTTDHHLHFLGKALTNRVRMYLAYLKLQIAIFDHLLIVRSQAHVFNFLRTWSNFKKLSIHKKKLYGPFSWMEFSCVKAREPIRGGSLLYTTKFPEIPDTTFSDLRRMKG